MIRELTHAVIKSRNVSTLARAMQNGNGKVNAGVGGLDGRRSANRLRNSLRGLKRHVMMQTRGPEAMRELWQKTGMKTNGGRKLIADSSVSEDNSAEDSAAGRTARVATGGGGGR